MKGPTLLMLKPEAPHTNGNLLLTGEESFHRSGSDVGLTVQDFWRWAYSDLGTAEELRKVGEFLVFAHIGSSIDPSKASVRVIVWLRRPGSRAMFPVPVAAVADVSGSELGDGSPVRILVLASREWAPKTNDDPLDTAPWRFLVVPAHALLQYAGTRRFLYVSERTIEESGGREVFIEQIASIIGSYYNSGSD